VGIPHCPNCGREISRQTVQQMVDAILDLPDGTRLMVLGPVIKDRKGEHKRVIDDLRKAGYVRVRVDGEVRMVDEQFELDRYKMHSIEAVVDRIVVHRSADPAQADELRRRVSDSVETALRLGDGVLIVDVVGGEELLFSEHYACAYCGTSTPEIEPRTFSFNSPHGACPTCTGLGFQTELDPRLIVPDPDLSVSEGALAPWDLSGSHARDGYHGRLLQAVAEHYGFSLETPWKALKPEHRRILLYGSNGETMTVRYENQQGHERSYQTAYEGIIPDMARRYQDSSSEQVRAGIEQYMTEVPCPACGGKRLRPESLSVTVNGLNIYELTQLSIDETVDVRSEALRSTYRRGRDSSLNLSLRRCWRVSAS